LIKILETKNEHIETLMVVGYDPSHKNVNSEVRTPYKILSTLLRMIDNESKAEKKRKNTPQKKSSSMNTYKFAGY